MKRQKAKAKKGVKKLKKRKSKKKEKGELRNAESTIKKYSLTPSDPMETASTTL